MEPVRIPRRVDEPPHLLLWSVDEIAPILVGLFIGVMLDMALTFILVGAIGSNLYRRFRENHADGYLLHMLYWAGLMPTKGSFKNPFIRRYIP